MSAREELELNLEAIKQIEDSIQEKYIQIDKRRANIRGLVAQVLKEENILNEAPWELRILSNGFYLDGGYHCDNSKDVEYYDNGVHRPKMFELLCDNGWGDFHHDIEEEGIRLHGSDCEVSLYVDTAEQLKKIIEKYELTVTYKELEKRINEVQKLVELQQSIQKIIENGS